MEEIDIWRSANQLIKSYGDKAAEVAAARVVEMQRAGVTYAELAERLAKHGLKGETANSIKSKLARGTFDATFFLACIAALELEGVHLEDL